MSQDEIQGIRLGCNEIDQCDIDDDTPFSVNNSPVFGKDVLFIKKRKGKYFYYINNGRRVFSYAILKITHSFWTEFNPNIQTLLHYDWEEI